MELKLYELVLSKTSSSKDIQNLIKSFYDPIEDKQRKHKKELLKFFDVEALYLCEDIEELMECLKQDKYHKTNMETDTTYGVYKDGLFYHHNGYVEEITQLKASALYFKYAYTGERWGHYENGYESD